jgi:glycosyltransferase involved in cell wall biosynthesis
MRIGIYFGNSTPQAGGAHTLLVDLLKEVGEMATVSEHRYIVFCEPSASATTSLTVAEANIEVVPVSRPSRVATWLKYSLMRIMKFSPLARYVRRWPGPVERMARLHDVQLIWFVGSVEYEIPDIPFVATMLDLQHRLQPYFPEVGVREAWDAREHFFKYSLQRASFCVTGTETGKREIENLYQIPSSRIRVLPLPAPRFARNALPSTIDVRSRFGIDGEYVFYPAQFWAHKNHINLVLALVWLKEKRDVRISLVLTGSDHGNLSFVRQFVIGRGLTDQVIFPGFVSEEELIALYQQSLALTFVTYFGPDNIPPLEAFALGCPVIASSVSGAQEQLGENVIHVDPSDPESIAKAILSLHNDQELRSRLMAAGIERASKWTSLHYVKGMFELFDEFARVRRNWA